MNRGDLTAARDSLLGFEYDWLACDEAGHVGLFSTAGGGHAPKEFLRDTDAHDSAIEAILAAQANTEARFAPELPPGYSNTWRLAAEHGLYAFDSDASGGAYRLVAAPERPVSLHELPVDAAAVVRRVSLRGMRFSECRSVDQAAIVQACEAE